MLNRFVAKEDVDPQRGTVSRISGLLTPWRVKWYPAAILVGLAMGFLIAAVSGEGAHTLSGRLGGDFPAFYAAGRLAASGELDAIYDLKRLSEEEKDYLPGEAGVLPFPYPPYVALAYSPFALFSFRTAFILHSVCMSLALIAAVSLMALALPDFRKYFLLILALAFSFYPMMRSIFGGQNTAVTVLLITAVWFCIVRDREFVAGLLLGALLFKPQFALPLIGLTALSRRWRCAITGAISGTVLFGGTYYFVGQGLIKWTEFASCFSRIDAGINEVNAVSFLGFLEAILGSGSLSAQVLGGLLVFVSVIVISVVWYRGGRRAHPDILIAVTCPALVLIPPHVMYYDISICILSVVAISGYLKGSAELVGLLWLFGWAQLLAPFFGFSPLFFGVLGLFFASVYLMVPELRGPQRPVSIEG